MEESLEKVRRLVSAWNRCHGAFYRVRESDLLWHLGEQDWVRYFPYEAAGVPVLLAEPTAAGMQGGMSRKTLWLCAWGEIPASQAESFASAIDKLAPAHGKSRLSIGGDEFHLVPGIPESPEDKILNAAAEKLGFSLAEAVDYSGSLSSESISAYIQESAAAGFELEEASSERGLDELDAYLQKEFPGRWGREFRFWRGRPDTRRAYWNVLRRDGGAPCGFARLALRGSSPGGWLPGALRMPLANGSVDSPTDSCLGPIGISASERGKGAGKALLGLSLQNLLGRGAERLCIDWTNAYNYYKPLGLSVVRKYRSAWKDY